VNTKNIKIKTPDGFVLDALYTTVENSSKAIIYAHGMTVNKDDEGILVRSEPLLNKLGYSTLRFDFRAHGKSSGDSMKDFTVSGELIDLETIIKFIDKDLEFIGLAAASFGGSIASLYVGKDPQKIDRLFLANPVLDFDKSFLNPSTAWGKKYFSKMQGTIKKRGFVQIGSKQFKIGQAFVDDIKKYNPCRKLKDYKKDIMIVHGDKDTKISIQTSLDCFDKLTNKNKKLVVITGSEHGFHEEPYETQVTKMIVNFFK
jgi:pimeloyl-ACP methyl ester carboxylesterase